MISALRRQTVLLFALFLAACASTQPVATPEVRNALAPGGKLRVGVYRGNPLQIVGEPNAPDTKGAGYELGRELARRLGVAFEPVVYPSIGALLADTRTGKWDVAFYQVNPARAKEVDFTPTLVEVELGYLVPPGSAIGSAAEIDRPQVRVATQEKGQGDVVLTRTLQRASVVRAPGLAAALEAVKSGRADAVGAVKPSLFEMSRDLAGWRVLEGRFATEAIAMAVPKGRDAGLEYARRLIAGAKADGSAKASLEKVGVRGAFIAPP
jgi:polar amino acid transport system substrate-binding protein